MTKHRMELFSDGVFVIVLTLLVLDLKAPAADGWAGLVAIAPGLAVHALTFFVVGMLWMTHHNLLARVYEITTPTLLLNLLSLFWVTLIPFGARIAAEHPLGHLGIGLIVACRGFFGLSNLGMIMTAASSSYDDPKLRRRIYSRRWTGFAISAGALLAAGLCAVSPWFGYAWIPTVLIGVARSRPLTPTAAAPAADDTLAA
jgi:uncharacterized membrane protein